MALEGTPQTQNKFVGKFSEINWGLETMWRAGACEGRAGGTWDVEKKLWEIFSDISCGNVGVGWGHRVLWVLEGTGGVPHKIRKKC